MFNKIEMIKYNIFIYPNRARVYIIATNITTVLDELDVSKEHTELRVK